MKTLGLVFRYLILIVFAFIILFPLFLTVMTAFNDSNTLYTKTIIPENFTLLGNFKRLFSETSYVRWYINSFVISSFTMILATLFVTINGFLYSRLRFKFRRGALVSLLVIQVIPAGSTLIALYAIANGVGIYNADSIVPLYIYLILIYTAGAIPMNTILMKGYYDSIPRELDESARIDGASNLKIFVDILIPLVKPMIAVIALFSFMGPIGDVIMPNFILNGTTDQQTLALGLNNLIEDPTNSSYNLFAAGSILVAVPILILFAFLQKHIVRGLAGGGVKG